MVCLRPSGPWASGLHRGSRLVPAPDHPSSPPSPSSADSPVIAPGPGPWRPCGDLMITGPQQRAERLRELPERSAATSCARKVEQGGEFRLIRLLHIARATSHHLLEAPLRITGTLGVPRSLGVAEDHLVPARRIEPGQEPSFVLAMRNHHHARSSAGCLRGDLLQARSQLGGAVVVAVEEDEDCTAIGLLQRDADRSGQLRLMCKLVARSANGPTCSDLPSPPLQRSVGEGESVRIRPHHGPRQRVGSSRQVLEEWRLFR